MFHSNNGEISANIPLCVSMSTIGIILISIFAGPYKELHKFESTYIPAMCKANNNYFYYEEYGISGSSLSSCEVRYKNIDKYRVLMAPDRSGCPTNIWSIYEGIDAYIYDEKTNTSINVGPIRIRHPSTSYSSMYTDNLKRKKMPWNYYLTMKPCYIKPDYKGTGFIEINYKYKIKSGFYAALVFLSIGAIFALLSIIEYCVCCMIPPYKFTYDNKNTIEFDNSYNTCESYVIKI